MATNNTLSQLTFPLFDPYPVIHGVFQRNGGASLPPFDSLNISDQVGDDPHTVATNRNQIKTLLGLSTVVFPYQEHGHTIIRITSANAHTLHHADALYTTERDIGLGIAHADCQAILFFDPIHCGIAVAHVGWKGSVQNLPALVVKALSHTLNTDPSCLRVAISPSLGPDHAEFINYATELPKTFLPFQVKPCFFNFWDITLQQLLACGVQPQHIEIAGICTACSQDYFSYRRERTTGRNATVMALTS